MIKKLTLLVLLTGAGIALGCQRGEQTSTTKTCSCWNFLTRHYKEKQRNKLEALIEARARMWIATDATQDRKETLTTSTIPNSREYTNSGFEIMEIARQLREMENYDRNTTDCLAIRMVEVAKKNKSEMGDLITQYRRLHDQYPSQQKEEEDVATTQLRDEIVTRMTVIAKRLHQLGFDAIDGITRY